MVKSDWVRSKVISQIRLVWVWALTSLQSKNLSCYSYSRECPKLASIGKTRKVSVCNKVILPSCHSGSYNYCSPFQYLDQLFYKDPNLGHEYHALQIRLYAEFDRPRLLAFLRSSNYYPLQGALEQCQERSLIPEMVFLLGNNNI